MHVVDSLEELGTPIQPAVLTIGNFDGVHLGHASVLSQVTTLAKKNCLPSLLITFKNHPLTVLRPNHPISLLTSAPHKLKLFEPFGIDWVIELEFTKEFAKQSAEEFLRQIHSQYSFRHLILGYDAKLGYDRQGDGPVLHRLAQELHCMLDFIPPTKFNHTAISSTLIRQAVQDNQFDQAAHLLGRKYSSYGQVQKGSKMGHRLGYPTANISLQGLCHPLFGIYFVTVKTNKGTFQGVADLGFAPTLRHDHLPLLEVHLIDHSSELYGEWIEVIYEEYLRPERVYQTTEELRTQISKDVEAAKLYFQKKSNN